MRIFEGHAFIVETAVSIGGRNIKAGLNIHRFANRIPLLFEGGSDVVTRTATKRINWGTYKINHTQDKVGVFTSIVSTKIPFKGAGKEYIGARTCVFVFLLFSMDPLLECSLEPVLRCFWQDAPTKTLFKVAGIRARAAYLILVSSTSEVVRIALCPILQAWYSVCDLW